MNEIKERAELVRDFFQAYPEEAIYDNVEEVNARLTTMRDCVVALRQDALAQHSVEALKNVHVMEMELNGIFNLLRQRQAAKAMSNGIHLASSTPDLNDPSKWRK